MLCKENSKWTVKGIVNPKYVVCKDFKACIDVKAYLYKKFSEQFPSVPPEIFPEVHPSRNAMLSNHISGNDEYFIFVVKHFKEKNGWLWIETLPRSPDGGLIEPINKLYKKEKGKWRCIESQPCCREYDEHPGIKKYGDFISYLISNTNILKSPKRYLQNLPILNKKLKGNIANLRLRRW